jgi:hypothetical protein
MNPGPVRLWPWALVHRERRAEESRLQGAVVQLGRHWPGDADHRRATQMLGHRVAADADRRRDAALTVAVAHISRLYGAGKPVVPTPDETLELPLVLVVTGLLAVLARQITRAAQHEEGISTVGTLFHALIF